MEECLEDGEICAVLSDELQGSNAVPMEAGGSGSVIGNRGEIDRNMLEEAGVLAANLIKEMLNGHTIGIH